MSTKRIHVNQHNIRANAKAGNAKLPVVSVKSSRGTQRGQRADIVVDGVVVASVIYRPEKPLSCGAKVWIETQAQVKLS